MRFSKDVDLLLADVLFLIPADLPSKRSSTHTTNRSYLQIACPATSAIDALTSPNPLGNLERLLGGIFADIQRRNGILLPLLSDEDHWVIPASARYLEPQRQAVLPEIVLMCSDATE